MSLWFRREKHSSSASRTEPSYAENVMSQSTKPTSTPKTTTGFSSPELSSPPPPPSIHHHHPPPLLRRWLKMESIWFPVSTHKTLSMTNYPFQFNQEFAAALPSERMLWVTMDPPVVYRSIWLRCYLGGRLTTFLIPLLHLSGFVRYAIHPYPSMYVFPFSDLRISPVLRGVSNSIEVMNNRDGIYLLVGCTLYGSIRSILECGV